MIPGMLTPEQGDALIAQGNTDASNRSMSAGLLGAAEGILTAPDLMSGLGKGFGGFNRGYNAALIANKPKVTPLADGAFSQVTMPDGTTKIVGNAQVADFLKNKWAMQADTKTALAILNGQVGAQRAGAADDIRTGREAEPMLNTTNQMIDTYNTALQVVSAQVDPNTPGAFWTVPGLNIKIPKAQLQGMVPGLAGFFGGDQAAANKFLQGLKVDETLLNTAKTKGAISNEEMKLFASPIPALTDDRETVWKPYLAQRMPVLQKLKAFYEQQVKSGNVAATGATVTGRPGAPAPTSSAPAAPVVPGVSPGTAQYFN